MKFKIQCPACKTVHYVEPESIENVRPWFALCGTNKCGRMLTLENYIGKESGNDSLDCL